jgi:N-dimethylarginine dimethylaminohydrolase
MGDVRDKILMCPPDHFTIDYEINPWMAGQEGSLDIELAKRQWCELRDSISAYADVVEMNPEPDLPDMVFTANAGAVYGNKAVASHFMPHERRPEERYFKSWVREKGFERLVAFAIVAVHGFGQATDFAPRSKRTRRFRSFLTSSSSR